MISIPELPDTGPTEEPVTLDELKAHARIDIIDDPALDDLLTGFIVSARTTVEGFTNRKLLTQDWTVYADTFRDIETLPIGLLPQIAGGVHVSGSSVGLLVTAYGLVVVIATIPLTRLTHGWSRRRLLTGLILTATVATAISALAPAYPTLLAGRLLAALSQAVFWAKIGRAHV